MKPSFRLSVGTAVVIVLTTAGVAPAASLLAADSSDNSTASQFDARATASPTSYCVDIPQVLVGQKICGGFIQSNITATTDPRGYALAGLAPVPKLSSVPLLIPPAVPVIGVPVPPQVQQALKGVDYANTPSQCQALFPVLVKGDDERTCGGPSGGDAPLGFIASGANAHVLSSGDPDLVTQTHTIAESRAADVRMPGLQSTQKGVYALAEGGLNGDGVPTSVADVKQSEVTLVGGLVTINGIRSRTIVSFDGTKAGSVAKTTFGYEDAAVAGVPVQITKEGVVVNDQKVPAEQLKTLTVQVNQVLKDNGGLGIVLLPAPPIESDASHIDANSGGILVTYRGSTGTEVVYSQLIGHTRAFVAAQGLETGSATDSGSSTGGGTDSGSTSDASGADSGVALPPGLDAGSTDDLSGGAGLDGGTVPEPSLAGDAGTTRTLGNPKLLTGFVPISLMSSAQLRNIYPAFCLLLIGSVVATRWRRRPVFERRGKDTCAGGS